MSRPKIYTWGAWRFEPVEYRLTHAGEQVTLAMKSLDLLALLISRSPRIATKAEILSTVWPDASVEEGNIAFHVAALRKVLDADGQDTCIETVRGRGYRFVAPVTATPVIIPPSTTSLDLPPEVKAMPIATPPSSWLRLVALTALAIVIAGGIGLAVFKTTRPEPILIAPFEIDDGVAGAENFGNAVTQNIVSDLSESGINAIERDRENETPRMAASRLGATVLLTGHMTLNADKRWDVSLRLLRVDDGRALWSWRFVAQYNEHRNQLEEQIAQRVADGLKSYLTLSGTEPTR